MQLPPKPEGNLQDLYSARVRISSVKVEGYIAFKGLIHDYLREIWLLYALFHSHPVLELHLGDTDAASLSTKSVSDPIW